MSDVCNHLDQIHAVRPHTRGCEECLKLGDTWVHLRLCKVGCCDSSKNRHATAPLLRDQAPYRPLARARRALAVVPRRRGWLRARLSYLQYVP